MTRSKVAVSLPTDLVAQAKRAVKERRAASVSAYVAEALEEKAKLDDLAALLDAMLAETGGPMTRAERRAADRALGLTRRRPFRKRVALGRADSHLASQSRRGHASNFTGQTQLLVR